MAESSCVSFSGTHLIKRFLNFKVSHLKKVSQLTRFLRYSPCKTDALMVKETFGPVGTDQLLWTYKLVNYEQNYVISRNTLAIKLKNFEIEKVA